MGMLLLGRDALCAPAEEDLRISVGGEGEYLVDTGRDDFPLGIGKEDLTASARPEGDFRRGGRTTLGGEGWD